MRKAGLLNLLFKHLTKQQSERLRDYTIAVKPAINFKRVLTSQHRAKVNQFPDQQFCFGHFRRFSADYLGKQSHSVCTGEGKFLLFTNPKATKK